MKSAPPEALDLVAKMQADLARLVQLISDEPAGEQPITVKAAAHRFGVCERTMQRSAEGGCGVKHRGRWYVYASQILLPVVNP